MSELRIPFDPFNPGQFYACCGLLELFDMHQSGCETRFVLDPNSPRSGFFELRVDGALLDLAALLKDLKESEWSTLEEHPDKAVRPIGMRLRRGEVSLDWWLDCFLDRSRDLKCWAGQVTTAKLAAELISSIDPSIPAEQLFRAARMMKTKFGIDPRSAWNALDVGFSPNEHGKDAATFPAVELLGAIGLQGFRPNTDNRSDVQFSYWQQWLPRLPARRAAVMPWSGLACRTFRFRIEMRGQSYKYCTFASPLERTLNELR